MRRIPWQDIFPARARIHVIVVTLPTEELGAPNRVANEVRSFQAQLMRLFESMSLVGDVATQVSRAKGRCDILAAFGDAADADRVSSILGATASSDYGGWATERNLVFNAAAPALRQVQRPLQPPRPRSTPRDRWP